MRPYSPENRPGGQSEQEVAPVSGLDRPGGQSVQVGEPVVFVNCPSLQSLHVGRPETSENRPSSQFSQAWTPTPRDRLLAVPAGQSWQGLPPDEVEKDPGRHPAFALHTPQSRPYLRQLQEVRFEKYTQVIGKRTTAGLFCTSRTECRSRDRNLNLH